MRNKSIEFDGGNNRVGSMWASHGCCIVCEQEKLVIFSDASEGEYEASKICKDCAVKMIDDFDTGRNIET